MSVSSPLSVGGSQATRSVRAQLTGGRRDFGGTAFRLLLLASLSTALFVLGVLLFDVMSEGAGVFTGTRLRTFLYEGIVRPDADKAGVFQAIRGSFWICVFVIVLSFPIGIGAAVYLEEYARKTRLNRLIDVNIRNLAGVPSVVYGILGLSIFVTGLDWLPGGDALAKLTGGRTLMSAGITLAILVLPIVIITAAEAIRAVPDSLREAGFGVGATRAEVIRTQVLPYALPGIVTGTVLSLARAIGEAAPLYLLGAKTGLLPGRDAILDPSQLKESFTALPVVISEWSRTPRAGFDEIAAAAIIVMLAIVLALNTVAIMLRTRYEKKRR